MLPPMEPAMRLRVLTYNIRHGEGLDHRLDLPRVADAIRLASPDIVCCQEVDSGVGRTHRRDLPAELARLLDRHLTFGPNVIHDGGDYGNLMLSRWAPVAVDNPRLPLRPGEERRGCLRCTFDVGGRRFDVLCTHLSLEADIRRLEVGFILERWPDLAPAILCGDLNETADGAAVRRLLETYRDSWPGGAGATFPAGADDGQRIDYILVRGDVTVVDTAILRDGPADIASDHRPYLAVIDLAD